MDENKNTEIIEKLEAEEVIAESAAVENVEEIVTENESSAAEAAIKPKSKIFIAYICALVVFMAVAITALVCFGLYANDLVHGEDDASLASYSTEYNDINV